ncbi:CoA-binding protein [Sulfitobacter dubius]|uniref:CoA-binding protein n=1 Tax=Sulfitobacter dubius TaxID=218673 RepID=UPI0030D73B7E
MTDALIKDVLTRPRRIAVVGVSPNPTRPSHYVAEYLQQKGYDVVPVNPMHAGKEVFGKTIVATLAEIDPPVQMVDIFRRSEDVPPVVDEALAAFPELETIWMQMGITNAEAAAKAEARGVDVIQDRCPKVEIPRLLG